jgi:hypothetical protein
VSALLSAGHRRRQVSSENLRGWNGSLRDPVQKAFDRVLFAVDDEQTSPNGAPRRDSPLKLRAVGVSRVFVDVPDSCPNLDFLAFDPHCLHTIV